MALPAVIKSTGNLTKISPKNLPLDPPSAALNAFEMLVKSHHEYKVIAQTEKTKRAAIEAWKETRLTALENQKEILKQYLESTFKERRLVIDNMFQALDKGLETNNLAVVNQAMQSIIQVVQSSPLEQAEKLMLDLSDDSVSRIEF